MEIQIKGILLNVESKEYNFEGQQGISHKLYIFTSDNKLFKVSCSSEQMDYYKDYINEVIDITCNLFVNGSYSLKLV